MKKRSAFAITQAAILCAAQYAGATATIRSIYSFWGPVSGQISPGYDPSGSLATDAAGDLFGTTQGGGTSDRGTVYELSGQGGAVHTNLSSFGSDSGSGFPLGGVTMDASGNLYGSYQTDYNDSLGGVFELSGANHQNYTTVATFNVSNGGSPISPLTIDAQGNIYGTTSGSSGFPSTVFELSGPLHNNVTVLAVLPNNPGTTGVVVDQSGNIYGVTPSGGTAGQGMAYELSGPNHQTFTTLVNFNGSNGANPQSQLSIDSAGDVFGTTYAGGSANGGTVFELPAVDHTALTTLCSFNSSTGTSPESGVTIDAAGDLFGTTTTGNSIVYELSGDSYQDFTQVASFRSAYILNPSNSLEADASGNLYGVTIYGGYSGASPLAGLVFEISGSGFAVPEPTALSVLALTGLSLLRHRRRG